MVVRPFNHGAINEIPDRSQNLFASSDGPFIATLLIQRTARMTHDDVQAWLDKYLEAWRTYDVEKISELFSEDALK